MRSLACCLLVAAAAALGGQTVVCQAIRAVKLEMASGEPAALVLDSTTGSRRVSLR